MSLTRRTFLASPLLGFLPRLPTIRADRALIVVWLDGGMTHLDTFDGKPEAPLDIRGDLKSIKSSVDGVFVSEHLPRMARLMDRCVLLRSLTHGEGNHDRGAHLLLTGHRPSPVLVYPSLPSLLGSDTSGALPPYIALPNIPEYGGPGFLGATAAPFETGSDEVKDLAPLAGNERALELLRDKDALDGAPRAASESARDAFHARARRLSLDPEARAHFDIARESGQTRARYGGHSLGKSLLRARRLVQGGARAVLVRDIGWDHHVGIRHALTYGFPGKLPALDESLSALIEDLDTRGLAEKTLVCLLSEFGRTPRLNPSGGRDHWPRAQCALLFGAGTRRGVAVGTTDARGEEPAERPITAPELHATILAALGADLGRTLRTPDGRPVRVIDEDAAPIREAL